MPSTNFYPHHPARAEQDGKLEPVLVLALDSSATASVALARVDGATVTLLATRESEDMRSHAEVMSLYVQEVLTEAGVSKEDIDAVLTGTGPGPFTGLRAGIVTARTLAFAWNKPLYGLMSLYALAERALTDAVSRDVQRYMVATDARRREIYSAEFEITGQDYRLVAGPTVGFAHDAPKIPAYGYGTSIYTEDLDAAPGFTDCQPSADWLVQAAARIGFAHLSADTSALYLRESDAKVPAARKKASQ